MKAFITHIKKLQLSGSTRDCYERIVGRIGSQDPIEFIKKNIDSDTPIGTVLPIRSAVKHYLISEKGMDSDFADTLLPKAKGIPNKLRDSLTEEELVEYKTECDKCPEPARTILLLLVETGMRIAEICNLRESNITTKMQIKGFLFRGKGSKQRFIPLNTKASKLIDEYLENYPPQNDFLFVGYHGTPIKPDAIRKWTRKIQQRNDRLKNLSQNLSPHLLRHTFATNSLRGGMDIKTLQTLMGHNSIDTTSRYLHPDAQMLYDALKSLEK